MKFLKTLLTSSIVTTSILSAATVGTLIKLQETGSRSNRINIAMVAEGYTSSSADSLKFIADLEKMQSAIFSDPVLKRYSPYFNFYGIYVKSAQAGADADNVTSDGGCTSQTKSIKDTYFGASYCTSNIQRLLVANGGLANTVALGHVPEAQVVAVLINSSIYGGSGGSISVANSGAPEIIAHEVGHSFVSLKDEYDYTQGYTPSEGINATAITNRSTIKWKNWVLPSTPLPTPETSTYNNVVGAFEGANYSSTGWFRPMNNCRMKSNGVDLCSVCAEAWVLKIYQKVSTIDSSTAPGNFAWNNKSSISVKPMQPQASGALSVKWYLDNIYKSSGNTFLGPISAGTHSLKAVVTDTSSVVRTDPQQLLKDSVVWNVTSTATSILAPENNILTQKVFGQLEYVDLRGMSFLIPLGQHATFSVMNAQGQVQFKNEIQGSGNLNFVAWPKELHSGMWIVQAQFEDSPAVQKTFFIE
jgi:hypothetical protein